MRAIERSSTFKRDYKRVKASGRHANVDTLFSALLAQLLLDQNLPANNRDHPLGGDWAGYRDCHVKPDLVLIYAKPDAQTLRLARLGSHSELFG